MLFPRCHSLTLVTAYRGRVAAPRQMKHLPCVDHCLYLAKSAHQTFQASGQLSLLGTQPRIQELGPGHGIVSHGAHDGSASWIAHVLGWLPRVLRGAWVLMLRLD